ncbi:MAG: MucR family transcriptional regulator [Tessaracoccus sp.]|nr:MucR family transcriptional regulator [Tessaracoccus sp.]
MTTCIGARCPDDALPGERLCWRHQKRFESGGGLPLVSDMVTGDPSGHGRYGLADIDTYGVACHECGERLISVPAHVKKAHGMSIAEYRAKHGLERVSLALPPDGVERRHRRRPCRGCGTPVERNRRWCIPCAEARDATKQPPVPKRRPLTAEEAGLLSTCDPDDLPELVRRLQGDRVPSNAIARVIGMSPSDMSERFPRR